MNGAPASASALTKICFNTGREATLGFAGLGAAAARKRRAGRSIAPAL